MDEFICGVIPHLVLHPINRHLREQETRPRDQSLDPAKINIDKCVHKKINTQGFYMETWRTT